MKHPLRTVTALGAAAVMLTVTYLAIDHSSRRTDENKSGGSVNLFYFDANDITSISIDNANGHYLFNWDTDSESWKLECEDPFQVNLYAVNAIANYFCQLSTERTVVFDCEDTSVYGFDHAITLKVCTTQTGEDNPYVLYLGDPTPTYDAYYAMTNASDNVYTIDYSAGTVFCAEKDNLKNRYLFNTTCAGVESIRLEHGDEVVYDMYRAEGSGLWTLREPAKFDITHAKVESMMNMLVRVNVTGFVEEHPQDLAKYGLDKPVSRLCLTGESGGEQMATEILFGGTVSGDESQVYGYFVEKEQVFRVSNADIYFTRHTLKDYMSPYIADINIENVASIEVDMGEVYDLHDTMLIDYAEKQYTLGDTDITARDKKELSDAFIALYKAVSLLRYSDIELNAEPEGEPVMKISYQFTDGTELLLEFIQKEKNNFYLMKNGTYTGLTVRLNQFSGAGSVIPAYESLTAALK